jgi:hypothetical protein
LLFAGFQPTRYSRDAVIAESRSDGNEAIEERSARCGWSTLAKESETLGLSWKILRHYDSEHELLKETIGLDPGRGAPQARL